MKRIVPDVRVFLLAVAACTGAVAPGATPSAPTKIRPPNAARAPAEILEPIAVLSAEPDAYPHAFIVPGAASVELGGPVVQAPPSTGELVVTILEQQSTMVRVAVRLEGVGFALWTERPRLLQIAAHDQLVSEYAGGGFFDPRSDAPFAELHAGAPVRVLGHKDTWTHVRYLGALEIEGWVPDAALVDRTKLDRSRMGRVPTGLPTLMVTPGTVVRSEPKWGTRELAVMANGYFLDTEEELDEAWSRVAYEDGDIRVRGFASRRDPPGRVHRPHEPDQPPAQITANATLARGTCLYDTVHGEPIGFLTANHAAELAPSRSPGWFTVALETPWGPITFAAQGASDHELATCVPSAAAP
jgi:hypothetical protein